MTEFPAQVPDVTLLQRGKFITFEGGEGAGKSTQIAIVCRTLAQHGIEVVSTREPGGTPLAEALRSLLLQGGGQKLGVGAEAILFNAARIDHIDTVIAPALAHGQWVICDRFADSTRIYQSLDEDGLASGMLELLEATTLGDCMPDLTFVFDIPVEIGLHRARIRRGLDTVDRFESQPAAFHEKLRAGFLEIARRHPQRCVIIDACQSVDQIGELILQIVADRLLPEPPKPTADSPEGEP